MARQCAIVVQRCAQAREGQEEGGVLGQLGKSIILVASLKDFSDQKVVVWARTHNRMGLWVIGGATQIVCDALGGE